MSEPVSPLINDLNAPFWSAAAAGRLVLPVCVASGRAFWPPSPVSPFSTGGEVTWRDFQPLGVVRALVTYRRVFQKVFETAAPYGVALVELDCGPRLQAHVRRPDDPGTPAAGDRVALGFEQVASGGPKVLVVRRKA